jgi:hypothetical protein
MKEDEEAKLRWLAFEQMASGILTLAWDRIDKLPLSDMSGVDALWDNGGQRIFVQCKTYLGDRFGRTVVLPATAGGGVTTVFPDLPAAYIAETQRSLLLSPQVFLTVLMWVLVIALPVLKQHLKVSPDTKQTMDDYYNIVLTVAGMITTGVVAEIVSARKKRKGTGG